MRRSLEYAPWRGDRAADTDLRDQPVFQNPPDANGYIGHDWSLPLPSNRFMRGGNEYEFHQPVRADDRITVRWRLLDIYERETSRAGVLIFVVSEARYTNQKGELLAVNRETNIHQP